MLNKHGKCPNCDCDWDDGDIKDRISKLDVFHSKTEAEAAAIAAAYGWTPGNPTRFTRLISIDRGAGQLYWRCPQCRDTYDQITGELVPVEKIMEEERARFQLLAKIQGLPISI